MTLVSPGSNLSTPLCSSSLTGIFKLIIYKSQTASRLHRSDYAHKHLVLKRWYPQVEVAQAQPTALHSSREISLYTTFKLYTTLPSLANWRPPTHRIPKSSFESVEQLEMGHFPLIFQLRLLFNFNATRQISKSQPCCTDCG